MLNLTRDQLNLDPFPHAASNQILDPEFYARLRADFPTADIFETQKSSTGLAGSRTGQGFDIYRGDEAYTALLSKSPAWREFDGFINSKQFVELFMELFGDKLSSLGCTTRVTPELYDQEYIEPRETLSDKASISERLSWIKRRFVARKKEVSSTRLFTRLDIHKALTGYAKNVHCDRPNRLCSFIIYFCDADKIGLQGGELTIHKHKVSKDIGKYERHPKSDDAPVVATVKAKENFGILFPCCNNSYHGVTAVTSSTAERDYLYINISGDSKSLW